MEKTPSSGSKIKPQESKTIDPTALPSGDEHDPMRHPEAGLINLDVLQSAWDRGATAFHGIGRAITEKRLRRAQSKLEEANQQLEDREYAEDYYSRVPRDVQAKSPSAPKTIYDPMERFQKVHRTVRLSNSSTPKSRAEFPPYDSTGTAESQSQLDAAVRAGRCMADT